MDPKELPVRQWRIVNVDGGVLVFVDPRREHVVILDEPDPRLRSTHHMGRDEEQLHGWLQGQLFDG